APTEAFGILSNGVVAMGSGDTSRITGFTNRHGDTIPFWVKTELHGQQVSVVTNSAIDGSGTLTGAANAHTITTSGTAFSSAHIGDSLYIPASNHTYLISRVVSSSQINTFEGIVSTYSAINTPWQILPSQHRLIQSAAQDVSGIAQDGTIYIFFGSSIFPLIAFINSNNGSNNFMLRISSND